MFIEIERIHIGTQSNGRAFAIYQRTNHTGFRHTGMNRNTKGFKLFGDHFSRTVFLEGGFGVGVNILPPGGYFVLKRFNFLDNRH